MRPRPTTHSAPDRSRPATSIPAATREMTRLPNAARATAQTVAAQGLFPLRNRKNIIRAGRLFTPCTPIDSLLEAMSEAAENATGGDVICSSIAGSSFDRFQNCPQRRVGFCRLMKSISRGGHGANPHMNGKLSDHLKRDRFSSETCFFSLRGFLRENHGANHLTTHLTERTPLRQIP